MAQPLIQIDAKLARNQFALDVRFESNETALALFGASGAGKSTILSLIAGLIRPDSGRIQVGDQMLVDTANGVFVPPHQRAVGLVFQDPLLFPHMSVQANLRYGQSEKTAIDFDALVRLLGIEGLLDRRPAGLSGGEKQRVAIGRAVLSQPRLLLLDEPLSSLDYARRQEIMPYLQRMRSELNIPTIVVSHALEEVIRLADEVIVLHQGQVREQGAPEDILMPTSWDDEGFGVVSVVQATVNRFDADDAITELTHPAGRISLPGKIGKPGDTHRVLVRATDVAIAVSRPREISHRTALRGRITRCVRSDGPLVRLDIALEGHGRLAALITRRSMNELGIDTGDEVFALAKASAIDDRAFAYARPVSPRPARS
jgi:molybdate transport system ATP-binding protein